MYDENYPNSYEFGESLEPEKKEEPLLFTPLSEEDYAINNQILLYDQDLLIDRKLHNQPVCIKQFALIFLKTFKG